MAVLRDAAGEKNRERHDAGGEKCHEDHMRAGLRNDADQCGQQYHQCCVAADPVIDLDVLERKA